MTWFGVVYQLSQMASGFISCCAESLLGRDCFFSKLQFHLAIRIDIHRYLAAIGELAEQQFVCQR